MKINRSNLALLKLKFEKENARNPKTDNTIRRYKSWIRRYIYFCRDLGVDISCDSALAFIRTYDNYTTRRQLYYVLKFLFTKVLKNDFFEIGETYKVEKRGNSNYYKKRRWFFF